jgi:sRNA-binding protein
MSTAKKHVQALHALLMDCFPCAFPKDYDDLLPLKLDIDADLRARLIAQGEPVDPDRLRRVLANHTGRAGYLLALLHRRDGRRFDLDGHPTGVVDEAARTEATRRLAALQQRQQAAAEQRRRREENERNRPAQRERLAQAVATPPSGPSPAPTVIYRQRRRLTPKDQSD